MEEASTLNLDKKLNEHFAGRVVRKDLTKLIKEGANVPIYVLEYLLGMHAATDDEASILEGVERVKKILAENFVRPDEAEKIKSRIRELGQYSIIDKVTVALNPKIDTYEAEFSNLGLKGVPVSSNYVKEFDKLLVGGIWCMVKIDYFFDEEVRNINPFSVSNLKPIQMPNMDTNEVFEGRKQFTKEEWIDVLIRSTGMEPTQLEERQVVSGTGKFDKVGVGSNREVKESLDTAFRYFTANSKSVSNSISTKTKDYLMHITDLQGIGLTAEVAIAELIGLCSGALEKPVQEGMVIIGNMTVGGTIAKVEEFANVLQVCVDAGAKKVLIPAACVMDFQTVPPDLLVKVQPVFYSDAIDAVFKALDVG